MEIELGTKIGNGEMHKVLIAKIRDLINFKNLEPGEKLPSERMLSEKFGVSRNAVREAIHKLEFYGILKSIPQSGTFVADIGIIALNGIIDKILRLKEPDFRSLVETRILLELKTVELAAIKRTDNDLTQIKNALDAYSAKAIIGENAVQEDLLFHLSIAEASKNRNLISLLLIITPEIINNFAKYQVCNQDSTLQGIKEHSNIYEAIKSQDASEAIQQLKLHFKMLYQYCKDASA